MISPGGHAAAFQMVRPNRCRDRSVSFVAGEGVTFHSPGGEVRATVLGLDPKARVDLPDGLPYRLRIREAPPHGGYTAGSECTIRAGCLDRDPDAPPPPPPLAPIRAAAPTRTLPAARVAAPAAPLFLVAYIREGGNVPVQGTVLVSGETVQTASAAAMAMLTAELAADVKERGELAEATVMLLNAAEVPPIEPPSPGGAERVLASVSW